MEHLYRSERPGASSYLDPQYTDYFDVRISKPGPRGGKRPDLIHASVRAESWSDAVRYVQKVLLRRCTTEVTG